MRGVSHPYIDIEVCAPGQLCSQNGFFFKLPSYLVCFLYFSLFAHWRHIWLSRDKVSGVKSTVIIRGPMPGKISTGDPRFHALDKHSYWTNYDNYKMKSKDPWFSYYGNSTIIIKYKHTLPYKNNQLIRRYIKKCGFDCMIKDNDISISAKLTVDSFQFGL